MANEVKTVYARGKFHWAKVIGAPRLKTGEFADGSREWTIDFTPDKDGVKAFKEHGIQLRDPKGKDTREERFYTFRQPEFNTHGEKNDPIKIVESDGKTPWGNKLIGNETVGEVKFVVKDYGKGKRKGVYIRAVRILDLVPYEVQDFAPLSEDDEFFAAPDIEAADTPDFEQDFGLETADMDDDIPE